MPTPKWHADAGTLSAPHEQPPATTSIPSSSTPAAMSRRQSRVSIDVRQNDTLLEFENCPWSLSCVVQPLLTLVRTVKKKFLLANKHITKCVAFLFLIVVCSSLVVLVGKHYRDMRSTSRRLLTSRRVTGSIPLSASVSKSLMPRYPLFMSRTCGYERPKSPSPRSSNVNGRSRGRS